MDDYIPNGNRQRPDDVIWRDFDETGGDVSNEYIEKLGKSKKNYKYLQSDGLFNTVIKDKKVEK